MKGKKIVTEAQQAFTFSRRSLFLEGAQLTIGAVLAGRMAWLSIAQNEKYALLAESNRVNLTLQLPRRGWLVDRNGLPLALNRTAFRIDIIPDQLQDKERVLTQLQQVMKLDAVEIARIRADVKRPPGSSRSRCAKMSIGKPLLPSVCARLTCRAWHPSEFFTRFYPDGPSVGHLVGYVGAASAKEYEKTKDPLLITAGFKIGKDGLEKMLEPRLRGEPGAKRTEVTARGKLVRELATQARRAGQDHEADHRCRVAGLCVAAAGAGIGIGGRDRLRDRRHPCLVLHALFRSQQLFGRDRAAGMENDAGG